MPSTHFVLRTCAILGLTSAKVLSAAGNASAQEPAAAAVSPSDADGFSVADPAKNGAEPVTVGHPGKLLRAAEALLDAQMFADAPKSTSS